MKQYLEIIEQLGVEEIFEEQPQQIRIEVTSKQDAIDKLSLYEPLFEGRTYIKRLHTCYHVEGLPCEIENL